MEQGSMGPHAWSHGQEYNYGDHECLLERHPLDQDEYAVTTDNLEAINADCP